MAGDIAQMVKGLPSKPEALSSKHQYYFKKKKKNHLSAKFVTRENYHNVLNSIYMCQIQISQDKTSTLISAILGCCTGGIAEVVQCVPKKCEVLGSISSTATDKRCL
jgi:hypothetical protein